MANAFTFNVGFKADTKALTESLKVFSGDLTKNPLDLKMELPKNIDTSAAQKTLNAFKAAGNDITGVTVKLQTMTSATGVATKQIVGLSGTMKDTFGHAGSFSMGVQNNIQGLNKNITQFDTMNKKAVDWANRAETMGAKEKESIQGTANALLKKIDAYKTLAAIDPVKASKMIPDIQRLNAEFEASTSVTKRAATAIQSWAANIQRAFMQTISYSLSLGVVREAQKLLNDAIKYTIDLNTEMVKIQVLQVAGAQTSSQIYSLADTYNKLAQQLGTTTLEVARGSVEWLRQGRTIEQTTKLLVASTQLAKLGALNEADATDYLTSTINSYKMSAEEAAVVVDKLIAVDNVSATSAGEMATALRYSAAAANEAGVSFDKLVSYIATISSVTRQNAEMIGQAMKTMLTRMQDIKAGAIDSDGLGINNVEIALARVNITLRDTPTHFRDMSAVLEELAGKWSTLNDIEQANIAKSIAGVRQANMFNVLMQNMTQSIKYQSVELNSAGTATNRYGIYLQSVEAAQNRLKSSFQGLVQSGKGMNVLMAGLYNFLSDILNVITKMGGVKTILATLVVLVTTLTARTILLKLAMLSINWQNIGSAILLFFTNMAAGVGISGSLTAALSTLGIAIDVVRASLGDFTVVIPILITILAALGIGFANASKNAQDFSQIIKDSQDKLNTLSQQGKDVDNLSKEYENLSNKTNKTAEDTQRLTDVQNQLKSALPELIGYYDRYGNFILIAGNNLEEQTSKIYKNIEAQKRAITVAAEGEAQQLTKELNESRFTTGGGRGSGGVKTKKKLTPEQEATYNQLVEDTKASFAIMGTEAQKAFIARLTDPELRTQFKNFMKELEDDAKKSADEAAYAIFTSALAIRQKRTNEALGLRFEIDTPAFMAGVLKMKDGLAVITEAQQKLKDNTFTEKDLTSWDNLGLKIYQIGNEFHLTDASVTEYKTALAEATFGTSLLNDEQQRVVDSLYNTKESASEVDGVINSLSASTKDLVSAMQEQADTGSISADTVIGLASAHSELTQFITYENGVFYLNIGAAKAHIQAMITDEMAVLQAAQAQLEFAQATHGATAEMALQIEISKGHIISLQAMLAKLGAPIIPKGGGGGGSAESKAKKAIQDEYDQKIKDAEAEKKALKDKLEGFKKIIDARKAILKSMKDEADYQDTLRDKQKNVSKIQAELLAISLDNSEEAQARRLQLQADLDKAQEDLEKTQADRAYSLQIDVLDKEYKAYEEMINAQIDLIDVFIQKLRDTLKELLDKTGGGGGGGGGGGSPKPPKERAVSPSPKTTPDIIDYAWIPAGNGKEKRWDAASGKWIYRNIAMAEGGLVSGGTPNQDSVASTLMPGEFVLRKSIVNSIGLSALNNLNKTGNMGSMSLSMPITVQGNLDKSVIPDIERIADKMMEKMNDTFRKRGVTRATNQYVN